MNNGNAMQSKLLLENAVVCFEDTRKESKLEQFFFVCFITNKLHCQRNVIERQCWQTGFRNSKNIVTMTQQRKRRKRKKKKRVNKKLRRLVVDLLIVNFQLKFFKNKTKNVEQEMYLPELFKHWSRWNYVICIPQRSTPQGSLVAAVWAIWSYTTEIGLFMWTAFRPAIVIWIFFFFKFEKLPHFQFIFSISSNQRRKVLVGISVPFPFDQTESQTENDDEALDDCDRLNEIFDDTVEQHRQEEVHCFASNTVMEHIEHVTAEDCIPETIICEQSEIPSNEIKRKVSNSTQNGVSQPVKLIKIEVNKVKPKNGMEAPKTVPRKGILAWYGLISRFFFKNFRNFRRNKTKTLYHQHHRSSGRIDIQYPRRRIHSNAEECVPGRKDQPWKSSHWSNGSRDQSIARRIKQIQECGSHHQKSTENATVGVRVSNFSGWMFGESYG